MNEERRRREMAELVKQIAEFWADRGQVLEGGWQAYLQTTLVDAPGVQQEEMRKAYFLGAQHLFATLCQILEPGREPTDLDMKRVMLIHEELEGFRLSQTQQYRQAT